eukprot:CAMPEP_0179326080 /NCGR_PEP_ID=MMETSP0797-20121207/61237_1 /TAXON_ID=47934 /ORGANISM="Dinophysis acuminata, Strain DAEP01" /LENGTH=98 /DNA_ID=CAMNT_0021038313 /DNA_START=30 /DNA_END=325 /DNA_ORIENTATION=-
MEAPKIPPRSPTMHHREYTALLCSSGMKMSMYLADTAVAEAVAPEGDEGRGERHHGDDEGLQVEAEDAGEQRHHEEQSVGAERLQRHDVGHAPADAVP